MQLRPVTHTARVSQISIFSLISSFNGHDSLSFRRPLHLNAFNFASGHGRWVTALTRPLGEVIRNFYVIQGFDIGLIEDCDLSQLSRRAGRLARSTRSSFMIWSVYNIKQAISCVT